MCPHNRTICWCLTSAGLCLRLDATTTALPPIDPMLIRWSDQEDPYNWTPASTNQAGFLRLSRGSEIVTATQSRQEVLVWTDASLYSLQYVGAPIVWGAQIVGENISIVGQNAVAYANGVSYWMGKDKFYKYDGRTQTLNCDLRRYVFCGHQHCTVFAGGGWHQRRLQRNLVVLLLCRVGRG